MDLWLPTPEDAPDVPEWFMRGLRDIDTGLVIYWNKFRRRFIIDRCTRTGPHTHDISCPKSNVLIVQAEDGGYMPPCQRVLDRIKGMDAWTKFGGNDEAAMLRQRKERENAKAEHDAKRDAEAKDNYSHARREDRVQINKAVHLIEQHDIHRVH